METTAQQVVNLFRGSEQAMSFFDAWRCAPNRHGVPEIALAHILKGVYDVTPGQIKELRDEILMDSRRNFPRNGPQMGRRDPRALHPLATIKPTSANDERAENWSAPMSFNLAFHTFLEKRGGKLFSYPEFRAECQTKEPLRSLLWKDAERLHHSVTETSSPRSTAVFLDAMHWRVGCAYYAFLKELYILARVRENGCDLLIHPLADTLFRTDFWTSGGTAISVFVPNKKYAKDSGDGTATTGRKWSMQRFLPEIFERQLRIQLPVPSTFGTADLPPESIIREICNRLDEEPKDGKPKDKDASD